jgi:hypothetical protein
LQAAGWALAGEPWLERYPVCIAAVPAPVGNARWVLADETGSVPIAPGFTRMAELVAVSGGRPVRVVGEWSIDGVLPLSLFTTEHAVVL